MRNNGFPVHAHKPSTPRQHNPTPDQRKDMTMKKLAPFTYTGRETTFITNLFEKTDLRITMPTNNSLQKLLTHKTQTPDKYSRSGAYKLSCLDCNKAYIGQTGKSITQRFKEHKNSFKANRNTSNYAKHLLEHSHTFGPIFETMQILQYQIKGTHLNTIERYFIYKEFSINNNLNDEYNISSNKIFNALLRPTNHKAPNPP
jgi:predicted GIY-YIG superfamily endonuclease